MEDSSINIYEYITENLKIAIVWNGLGDELKPDLVYSSHKIQGSLFSFSSLQKNLVKDGWHYENKEIESTLEKAKKVESTIKRYCNLAKERQSLNVDFANHFIRLYEESYTDNLVYVVPACWLPSI